MNWEKEFDEIFWQQSKDILCDCEIGSGGKFDYIEKELKSFIKHVVAETKKETIQECIDRVKSLERLPGDDKWGACINCGTDSYECTCGDFNSGVRSAVDKLKEIKVL